MGVLPPGTTLPGLLVKETMIWLATAPRASGSGPAGPVLAGPLFHSREKKKKFLVGFDQCGFTAWRRKSSKYSNNVATVTPVSLQRACDNRSSVVSSIGLGVLHCGAGMRSRLGCGLTT